MKKGTKKKKKGAKKKKKNVTLGATQFNLQKTKRVAQNRQQKTKGAKLVAGWSKIIPMKADPKQALRHRGTGGGPDCGASKTVSSSRHPPPKCGSKCQEYKETGCCYTSQSELDVCRVKAALRKLLQNADSAIRAAVATTRFNIAKQCTKE